ncbi:MAG: translational GTPase TypA [Firmicutes bacterium]|nr:translational GTPase TypA [Bacillota bacterium]MDY5041765.1 translational GTPase TypA [Eubacteriales bacterium]
MKNIRNVAIIAHVDHGKTSLVNELLKQGGVFRENQQVMDRVMDSNAIERERGITIFSKNAALMYNGVKINVVDTPGHADFGGEVERVLKMVDGVLLVVDSFEGPMPQTRFVLKKALELNHKVIVVINKIDKKDQRVKEVVDEVLELFLELDATEEQLNSPFVYASARDGVATLDFDKPGTDMKPLLQMIIDYIPEPKGDDNAPFQMLVSSSEQNDYLGKLAIGKIERGTVKVGQTVAVTNYHDNKTDSTFKISNLFLYEGLKQVPSPEAVAGDIVCVAGSSEVTIGDTICDKDNVEAISFVKISEPSVEMTFSVNNSPFAGKEGKYCTSRHLRDRLIKESVKDLSLKVFDTESADSFRVLGRGEMHISILIENMRRDGYEFQVSMPKVLIKEIDGVKCEPIDRLVIDVPEDCVGNIMVAMGERKGDLVSLTNVGTRTRLEFLIPSRGLFGYKSQFLTDTRGEGVMSAIFEEYAPYKGHIARRNCGALVAYETGEAVQYGLFNTQERGRLLITPGTKVYQGMVVGMNPKGDDIVVNVCKKKALSNMRSCASDDALRLEPVRPLTLEESLEFLNDDELLEVTPQNLRIRKIILDHTQRGRADFRRKNNIDCD